MPIVSGDHCNFRSSSTVDLVEQRFRVTSVEYRDWSGVEWRRYSREYKAL